jgi:conjugative relaxase-like TrwC/TraI family protein
MPRRAAVLTIGKLGASPGQLAYYEQQIAHGLEDYLSGRGEAPGRWIGGGCGGIGVAGQVDRDVFMLVMAGCDPETGTPLRPPRSRTKVAAFDLTFSAPKSVSVLFAIADDEIGGALSEAHERAVEAAFGYVEREACFTRRGHAGALRVRGEGFVAAAYRHRLSRAGDPQLHTHVVVANMTRAQDRWTTLDAHDLYEHALAAGAVYRAVLRAEVRERLPGMWWRPAGRGLFEIEGVPDRVLREFSRRRVEIEERALELTGVATSELSRERMQGIALATRKAKEYGVDGARWREEARARAAEHGLTERGLRRLVGSFPRAPTSSEAEIVAAAALRLSGPDGLTANHNTFARRHALAELAGEFLQGASLAQLDRASSRYLDYPAVAALDPVGGEERFTTRELLRCEQAILDSAWRRADTGTAVLSLRLVEGSLDHTSVELNSEQAAAVHTIAASGNGVDAIHALAGTGKTRVLGALAGCYRDADYLILGVAPTGRAARELGEAIGTSAYTVHSVVAALDRAGDLLQRTVVLLDEAGMAPTRQSAVLFEAAERAGAKLIAAGDVAQLPSVQAGGWFTPVGRELGGPQLREVMRQRDPAERAALEALHDGRAGDYLEFKQAQRALNVHADRGDALAAVLHEWEHARAAHGLRGAMMIAPDNATRQRLNQQARARLIDDGALSASAVVIGGREFRVGERVIARRNDRQLDVDNGTLATVRAMHRLTGTLRVELDGGGRRELDSAYVGDHVEYAYALTGHGTQGASVEWAAVVGRPSEFNAEWAYTALSRARGQTQLHLIAERSAGTEERAQYAPAEAAPTAEETLISVEQAMLRRRVEPLAVEQHSTLEANPGTELASRPPPEPSWRSLRQQRDRGRAVTRAPRL